MLVQRKNKTLLSHPEPEGLESVGVEPLMSDMWPVRRQTYG